MRLSYSILLITLMLILTSCGYEIDTNMSQKMVDFEFTTQDEEKLALQDLKGDWWIANFVYTNCRTICPRTTTNLANIQNKLASENVNPTIVSFSVDPVNDTPEVLREYTKKHDIDLSNWYFLTGYDFETIRNISETTFKSVLREGALDQRTHSYKFFLINPTGNIVKKYDGMSSKENEMLIEDIIKVMQ